MSLGRFALAKKTKRNFGRTIKLACVAGLAAMFVAVYQYGLSGSLQQLSKARHLAQSWAKEYISRPEAGWRRATDKLNDLLPDESVPTRFDLTGRVVRIADGDTISVLDANNQQHSIRFYGIDTPEYNQPHGRRASIVLAELLADETVDIVVKDVDRLGRTVGVVYLGNTNINVEMIKNGHAWWYRHYAATNRELKSAEHLAKLNKLGLWSRDNPVAPWEWRRGKRQ